MEPNCAGGLFGRWVTDDDGLDCFDLDPHAGRGCSPGGPPVLPEGGAAACWHQVGNASVTATAHAGGWTTLWSTARGMVRLTDDRSTWGPTGAPVHELRARWGQGYAEWTGWAGPAQIRRRVSAGPGAEPWLRVEVEVRGAPGSWWWEERWIPRPVPLLVGGLVSRSVPAPTGYSMRERVVWRALFAASALSRSATDGVRRLLGRTMRMRPDPRPADGLVAWLPARRLSGRPPRRPAWFDPALPLLVVAALDEGAVIEGTTVLLPIRPDADGVARAAFAVLLTGDEDRIHAELGEARRASASGMAAATAAVWRLGLPADPELERESRWHATYLFGARQHDDWFGHSYVSQGSAYGFVHGVQGAPRDYALSAVPLSLVDPAVAKETLRVMLRMVRRSGAVHYAHTGRGRCTSGGIHAAPTDLPLFLLWALTEYVWATGDHGFLDEAVPVRPSGGPEPSVADVALRSWRHTRDRVGTGPHGMLRVGSGDWSDPISAMVADRRAFHRDGESGFNTALGAYVLPRAAALFEAHCPVEAEEMRELALALARAMEQAWTGRWFLRGWDGRGTPIGEDHLFLDGQVWALIAGLGPDDRRATLVEQIARRCDDPSPIGATILDRPHRNRFGMLAPGWDCNGGVWAAINGLLAWGYAEHDPELAWRSVQKQSLAAHARAYPEVWYGIWSGPDAYNSHFGDRPGETFVQPATPMVEYPVMNSNAHAGPMLALLRVLGVETTPTGPVVAPRAAPIPDDWELDTPLGTLRGPRRARGAHEPDQGRGSGTGPDVGEAPRPE